MYESFLYFDLNLKSVSCDPIKNMSALGHVMAWHQIGAKALHEPMITQFSGAYTFPGLSELSSHSFTLHDPALWS